MRLAEVLLQRETIVATAILGASLATAASLRPVRERAGTATAAILARAGYALTAASMLLMIVAGFLSER